MREELVLTSVVKMIKVIGKLEDEIYCVRSLMTFFGMTV